MDNKWQCRLKPLPKKITVGQKLNLFCEGGQALSLKRPLSIRFQDKKDIYSLHILKTLKQEDGFLALEVTSYRTGLFNSPFFISDGENKVLVENLFFSVQSVLPKKQAMIAPHGAFGPFKDPLSLWQWMSLTLSFLLLAACLLLFVRRLWKRANFIKKVRSRKTYLQPSKGFVRGLRKKEDDSPDRIKNMEELFKTFLEDLFFVPALNRDHKEIMKSLKIQHNQIHKKEGEAIRQILDEFSALQGKTANKQNLKKLKKLCQDTVFRLDKKEEDK